MSGRYSHKADNAITLNRNVRGADMVSELVLAGILDKETIEIKIA
jgi:hypothetical protein